MSVRADLKKLGELHAPVLVLGLGKTGEAAARFFSELGCEVTILEKGTEESFYQDAKRRVLQESARKNGAQIYFDGRLPADLKRFSLCVISPGIPLTAAVPEAIRRSGVPMIGELELGIQFSEIPSVVVTGSNGKSTVATILSELLSYNGNRAYLCGNIGNPVVNLLGSVKEQADCLVVEASSYQLESCTLLKPSIAVLLNISDNHLERHVTIEQYRSAKLKLFQNQGPEDAALLNSDDPLVVGAASSLKGNIGLFGKNPAGASAGSATIFYEARRGIDKIVLAVKGGVEEYSIGKSRLIGEHNRYNWAACILAARLYGAPPTHIQECIESFAGLPHRLEVLTRTDEKVIINDSKSTTVASSVAALHAVRSAFPAHRIVLLVGGKMKEGSWKPLAELAHSLGKTVSVRAFGGDGAKVAGALSEHRVHAEISPSLKEAVEISLGKLGADEVLLLSPGCASFDEFSDFEARGDYFRGLCL